MIKYYIAEALEPTLLFAPLCSLLGIIVASTYSKVNISIAVLLVVGVFFAQMAVNVLNDYVDYKGIDKDSIKTKFSGGSKLIVDGHVRPKGALLLGLTAFAIAAIIGIYFIFSNLLVIPIVIIGALSILLYTSYFTRIPFLSEPIAIINFTLCGIGSFIVINSSTAHLLNAVLFCLPAGIAIGMALLINEMPDRKVDQKYGRKSGSVMLKSNTKIAYYYLLWQILGYVLIIFGILSGRLPHAELIFFISTPLMFVCFLAMKKYSSAQKFEKYMGINAVYTVLLALLLIVGYII